MKTGDGIEVKLHAFITSTLDGRKVVSFTLYAF
jgi:hypothetical protein